MNVEVMQESDLWVLSGRNFRAQMSKASASSHQRFKALVVKAQREAMVTLNPPTIPMVRSHSLLLCEWSDSGIQKAIGHLEAVICASGDILVKDSELAQGIYLVVSGRLDKVKGGVVKDHVNKGESVSEMATLLGTRNDFTYKASKHTRLWFLNRMHVMELFCHEQMFTLRPIVLSTSPT